MVISYIGLGSNIARASSSPKEQLEIAVDAISVHPKISLEKISSFYQSKFNISCRSLKKLGKSIYNK